MAPKRKHPKVIERKLGRERALGMCYSDGLIEIDERIKGKLRLDTLIHEYLHHKSPKMREKAVNSLASSLADFLWQNKVRIIDEK